MSMLKTYEFFLHGLLKLVGLSPRKIEIEPGTVINVWGPTKPTKKPALVFVHGVGFDGVLTWQFQAFAFAKDYSVYLPDLLFFGGSVTDKAERSAAFQAECVAKALWKLGVDKCTVVGLSYGGMVSFKMAEMYPELVESMVATCTVMSVTESIRNAGTNRLGISDWGEFMFPDTVEGLETLMQLTSYKASKLPKWIYKDLLVKGGLIDYKKERLELLEALQISDNEFTVPCFKQRIHLLWGENDMLFDLDTARNMKRQIGENASLEYIEKAGHNVPLDRPFEYNSRLKKILASFSSNPNNV
ncbi:hypothetical protein V6N11_074524 [Hibiscus sabdariffa]|uniref:AB hydrolase-1 domain-containing protein n=1 Tax=Hibiscus sabdariffa TaxID=183260 RepID=A0ABR2R3U4_9ROSI